MKSKKEEIKDLKEKIEKINERIKNLEESSEGETEEKPEKIIAKRAASESEISSSKKKSYVGWLVFLIIVLLILDFVSLYVFYKPDMPSVSNFLNFKTGKAIGNQKCEDGTPYNQCSKNKPYYCYQGELLKNANSCGCPAGYEINFQSCKPISS